MIRSEIKVMGKKRVIGQDKITSYYSKTHLIPLLREDLRLLNSKFLVVL